MRSEASRERRNGCFAVEIASLRTWLGSKNSAAKRAQLRQMRSNVLAMLEVLRCDERRCLKALMVRDQLLVLKDKLLEFVDLLAL